MQSSDGRKYMLWLPITAAVFLIIGLWGGRWLSSDDDNEVARQKLDAVFNIIQQNYVDEVDIDSMIELTIPELLKNLDPHSTYIPADERVAVDRELEGSFYGIGIQFQMMKDTLHVIEVISGGAADEAGVLAGDKIIEVDSVNIAGVGTTTDDIFNKLRGPEGTKVNIKVKRRNSPDPIDFELIRAEVPVSPIDASYLINDTIGYIRLGKFSDNTYPEFLSTIAGLRRDGAQAFILDLRGNGGGYMTPSVLIANEFFDQSDRLIVSTRGRNFGDNRALYSDRTGSFGTEPLAVLIDEFSASSSEILAGAIQDNDRGIIIGRRSFGKGLVQQPFELPDSSEFRLTVQRYYTPSGRCIQKTYSDGRDEYESEIYNRYSNGEIFNVDSIHIDSTQIFHTAIGRPVYGGGGIMPDIFVPSDTTGITSYYIKVVNDGLLRDFAYEYADLNRASLSEAIDTNDMLSKLPADHILLQSFANYAQIKGDVAPRWYYINISANLILDQIKALIARDIVGMDGYFQVINNADPVVNEAIRCIQTGDANSPISVGLADSTAVSEQ